MSIRMRFCFLVGLVALHAALAAPKMSYAVPTLQIYIEGATFNSDTQSWVATPSGSSAGEPFRLWVIGHGDINDVKLSAAYSKDDLGLSIDIQSGRAGGTGTYNGVTIPSMAVAPTTDGVIHDVAVDGGPVLGDGKDLPIHGIYVDGTVWQEWSLSTPSSGHRSCEREPIPSSQWTVRSEV